MKYRILTLVLLCAAPALAQWFPALPATARDSRPAEAVAQNGPQPPEPQQPPAPEPAAPEPSAEEPADAPAPASDAAPSTDQQAAGTGPAESKKPPRKLTLRVNEAGMMMIEGFPQDVANFDFIYKEVLDRYAKVTKPRPDIRIYQPKYIDVTLAKAILDDVFNGAAQARQRAAMMGNRGGRQNQRQPQQQQGRGRGAQQAEEEPAPEQRQDGLRDLLGSMLPGSSTGDAEFSQALAALSGDQEGVVMVAEPQRGMLIVKAKTEVFPSIAELLAEIDIKAEIGRDFDVVALTRLSAEEVQETIDTLLGLNQPPPTLAGRRTAQRRGNRANQNQQQGGVTDAELLAEQLQQQILQIGGEGDSVNTKDLRVSSMPATNSIIVFGPTAARQPVVDIIKRLDGQGPEERVKSYVLSNADAETLAKTLNDAYGRSGGENAKAITITANAASNTVYVVAPPAMRGEIEQQILQAESLGSTLKPRMIAVTRADANTIAETLKELYKGRKTGKVQVEIAADPNSNQVLVSAPDDIFAEIQGLVAGMDTVDAQQTSVRTYPLKFADATQVKDRIVEGVRMLAQSVSVQKGKGGGMELGPFSVMDDPATNSLVVIGSPVAFTFVEKILGDIDQESSGTRRFRQVQLTHVDAVEVANVLNKTLEGQGTARGQTKPTVTPSAATNSLIVWANSREMAEFDALIDSMDVPEGAGGFSPRRIQLAHLNASEMADLLTRVFTEPSKQLKGNRGGDQRMVPLIEAVESSNSLIVRAQELDYSEIAKMVADLDVPTDPEKLTGARLIQVAAGIDVMELAATIEETIKEGEDNKKRIDPKYVPKYVAVGADARTNALIVAGASAQFEEVERLVRSLEQMSPTGPMAYRIVNIKNRTPADIKKVLDQIIEERGNRSPRGGRR